MIFKDLHNHPTARGAYLDLRAFCQFIYQDKQRARRIRSIDIEIREELTSSPLHHLIHRVERDLSLVLQQVFNLVRLRIRLNPHVVSYLMAQPNFQFWLEELDIHPIISFKDAEPFLSPQRKLKDLVLHEPHWRHRPSLTPASCTLLNLTRVAGSLDQLLYLIPERPITTIKVQTPLTWADCKPLFGVIKQSTAPLTTLKLVFHSPEDLIAVVTAVSLLPSLEYLELDLHPDVTLESTNDGITELVYEIICALQITKAIHTLVLTGSLPRVLESTFAELTSGLHILDCPKVRTVIFVRGESGTAIMRGPLVEPWTLDPWTLLPEMSLHSLYATMPLERWIVDAKPDGLASLVKTKLAKPAENWSMVERALLDLTEVFAKAHSVSRL